MIINGECETVSTREMTDHEKREYEILRAEEVRRNAPGCRRVELRDAEQSAADFIKIHQQWQNKFRSTYVWNPTNDASNSASAGIGGIGGFFRNLGGL